MSVCEHVSMRARYLSGPLEDNKETIKWNQYAHFECGDCGLDCFRQRTHGRVYNGAWQVWVPGKDKSEKVEIYPAEVVGNSSSYFHCAHPNIKKTVPVIVKKRSSAIAEPQQDVQVEIAQTPPKGWVVKETAHFECELCHLNCTRQREIGTFYNGPWQKVL